MLTTRYMPATGAAIRLVEPMDAVWEASARLPWMVGVEMQLPAPLIACELSHVPTPEYGGSLHTVPSKYTTVGRPATIWPLVGSVTPSDCLIFLRPTLSTFNEAEPVLVVS